MSDTSIEPVKSIRTPMELHYEYYAGRAASRFLRGIEQGEIRGQRCPQCGKVYVPPRGACAACGVATDEEVKVSDKGIVTTFCVVNVPFYGQKIEIPYVSATIPSSARASAARRSASPCPAAVTSSPARRSRS